MEIERHTSKKKKLLIAAVILAGVVLLGGGVGAGFWFARHSADSAAASDSEASKKQKALQEIGKIYLLPTSEDPTVAIIQNKQALGSEAFFKNAQNGDYVVIYRKAGLGIIYRQSERKLINIATVAMSGAAGGTTPAGN